jgi:hypothetical protein
VRLRGPLFQQWVMCVQEELTLRITSANLKMSLGVAAPEDIATASLSARLSHDGIFSKDGSMTRKRFTFSKRV